MNTTRWVILVFVLACAMGVSSGCSYAVILLAESGWVAALILAASASCGLAGLRVLGLHHQPRSMQWIIGTVLGLGVGALVLLGLGLAGCLSKGIAFGVAGAMLASGVWRIPAMLRAGETVGSSDRMQWLWLVLVPMAVVAVLSALTPPGWLWAEEGNGYDVLEYHLQMPKEYFESGCVAYAPHNVYAAFPENTEMLYLWCMLLKGDPIEGLAAAKLLNLAMGVLVVACGWLLGRTYSSRAGIAAGVLTGGIGWICYLAGIAYVELAMVMFGMASLVVLLRGQSGEETSYIRWVILAGVLAGLSAGCKYPAVVMIAMPLGLVVLFGNVSWVRRIVGLIVFGIVALAVFSPWMVRNIASTANPFFPLAHTVFASDAPGWGDAQADHFAESHKPAPDDRTVGAALRAAWTHIPADSLQRFGPLVLAFALVGLIVGRRSRWAWAMVAVLVVQMGVWLFGTHHFARFAVPMLLPLIALAAQVATAERWSRVWPGLLVAGVAFNSYFIVQYARAHHVEGIHGATRWFVSGEFPGYEFFGAVNGSSGESKVLLVGEARPLYFTKGPVDYGVVFNRSPFVEAVEKDGSPEAITRWLNEQEYTDVLVNWREINRLRSSRYGFPDVITPELFESLNYPVATVIEDSQSGNPYAVLYRVPR